MAGKKFGAPTEPKRRGSGLADRLVELGYQPPAR